MQHPFKHPLATVAADTVLGRRRNGSPIYAIAGGSGEGDGGSGTATPPPVVAPATPPATPPVLAAPPAVTPPATGEDGTDWKAMARQWEKRSKENSTAATELEKLKRQSMSDQEKAVADAEAKGRTAAATEYGKELAAARFEAAAATAGVQLGEAAGLIDMAQFLGADGKVDSKAITTAVAKLAKLAPARPTRSGGELPGAPGGGTGARPTSLGAAIGAHYGR